MPWQPPPRRRAALHVVMGEDGLLHVGRAGHIRVKVASVNFACRVIDDLAWINTDPGGAGVLDDSEADSTRVLIVPPESPIDPPNGTVQPFDRVAATASGRPTGELLPDGSPVLGTGRGSASRICYDPEDWPSPCDPAVTGPALLLTLLRQARVYAAGTDVPTDGLTCVAKEQGAHG